MDCRDFLEQNVESAIRRAREESDSSIVFLHVPKTGGTSLQRDLNLAFPDSIHIPQGNKPDHWETALNRLQFEGPNIVRGHLNAGHVEDLHRHGIDCRLITYLRHPVDRMVSQYLWRVSNHRNNPEKFAAPKTFRDFCTSMSKNYLCEILIGPVQSADEAIDKFVKRFWFVGLTEFYHVCQSVLLTSLGADYRMRQRRNKTSSSATELAEIDPDGLEVLKSGMQIDLAVYDYFHSRWSSQINDSVELLMRTTNGWQSQVKATA